MAPPTNLDCARSVETIIRAQGATPATIALIDGKVHVGLTKGELEMIADPDILRTAVKTSRRDIAPVLAQKRLGGTTVAGTMYIASSVGIPVFVTGGIGGVHRGAESSQYMSKHSPATMLIVGMDISADLTELGRTVRVRGSHAVTNTRQPVTVVCAGAKSILDIPRTLEYLETQGVCVTTYGPKPEFPAFYTPYSGQKVIIPSLNMLFCTDIKTQWAVQDPVVAARIIGETEAISRGVKLTPRRELVAARPSEHLAGGSHTRRFGSRWGCRPACRGTGNRGDVRTWGGQKRERRVAVVAQASWRADREPIACTQSVYPSPCANCS